MTPVLRFREASRESEPIPVESLCLADLRSI